MGDGENISCMPLYWTSGSNSSIQSVLAFPKILEEVSSKNTELPVESPIASCRGLNRDQITPRPWGGISV